MAVLVVLTSCLSIFNYIQASKSMHDLDTFLLKNNLQHNMSIAYTYLDKYYGNITYQNGVLVDKNGKAIAGDMQMVDSLSTDAGGVATIFAKSGDDFVRISTNILNDKGQRAVGTMLGKTSPAYTDVSQGKNFLGQANILNKPYLTAYNPLLDKNGQVIGLLFVGIPQSESAANIQVYLNQIRNTALLVIILALLLSLLLAYFIGNSISKPIISIASHMRKLASGDLSVQIEDKFRKRKDEIGTLTECLGGIVYSIKGLTDETNALAESTVAGRLDARIDITKHQGEYKKVVEGINSTLDALTGPLNMTAEYVERISKGDIPEKITEKYYGDFNEIKNNLNACIDGLGGLVESSTVLKRMAINDYTRQVEGQYQGIFAETAQDVNTVRERLLRAVEVNTNIAKGDFAHELELFRKIGRRCEEDQLIPSYLMSMENIQRLVIDAGMMTEATIEGRLDTRIDVTQHQGEYCRVAEGINNTLDAVIGPLNMAAEYIERIAQGNTPPKITDKYNGDFNEIKNNLNTCIDEISVLVEEVGVAINAAAEGKLDQRANADRGKGVYRKILLGVNATMEALVAPVNEAILVINEMAQGQLSKKMIGNYQGDNAKLKNELNTTIDSLAYVIGEVSETLGQIANGNLDISLDKDFQGDFVSISSALKLIIESLNEVMGDINQAAEQVADGSQQVSDSSQALAQGANEQASAIEQLTSAITEIAAQTKQNATNANQANELALNARDNAAQGNDQMQEMLSAMEGINDSSANISKIIKVIDEIAFQTNILALNAAVEAARAGQHGKGFAVVAEEVRNLAARSASAAKETTDLIEGSIRKVQSGTKIANDTAQALNKIVNGVSQAAELVGDIAVASNEQATGIAQVDQGIVQVSQVVQTNSATAQQSAAASEELSSQAGLLKDRVSRFQLRGTYTPGYDSKAASQNRRKQEAKFISPGMKEAAATRSAKARITLDDGDFGKY